VIRDTVNGVSIDDTVDSLDLHHETVFNMRHKILYCLEQGETVNPTNLTGVCEADEIYVLESYKGKKFDPDFWREPRKHGAVAKIEVYQMNIFVFVPELSGKVPQYLWL